MKLVKDGPITDYSKVKTRVFLEEEDGKPPQLRMAGFDFWQTSTTHVKVKRGTMDGRLILAPADPEKTQDAVRIDRGVLEDHKLIEYFKLADVKELKFVKIGNSYYQIDC